MAEPEMTVVGLHPVDGAEGCYLIESIISDATTQPDFGRITQRGQSLDPSNWQVPYDEKLLDDEGQSVIADLFLTKVEAWPRRARVSFFLHNLDAAQPLATPYGDAQLPPPSARPTRLAMLVYETP
jgi:hypothetical protein